MKKLILLTAMLFLIQSLGFSQKKSNELRDSLFSVLTKESGNAAEVNTLNALAFEFRNNDPDTSIYFSGRAIALSTKLNDKTGTADAHLNISSAQVNLGNYVEAMKNTIRAIKIYDELLFSQKSGDSSKILKQKARAHTINGNIGFNQGNYPEALKNYFTSLKIREEIGDKTGVASVYNNIASLYVEEGNYPEALKIHLTALKIREELNDKDGIATSYNNIGNVYHGMHNYAEALKMHFAALKIRQEIGYKKGISDSYNNIGGVYNVEGKYPEALTNHLAALKIRVEIGDQQGLATSYNNIGSVFQQQNNYTEALKNYFAALKIAKEIGDKPHLSLVCVSIGSVYVKQRKHSEASIYLNKGLLYAKEINGLDYFKNAYAGIAELDISQGNFKQALEHYKLYVTYRDSLFNEENTKNAVQSRMQYEFDKKESIVKAAQEKKDIVAQQEIKQQRNIRNSTFAGLAVVLLFSMVVFRQRNKIAKEKKRSDQLVLDKEILIKEIHHRVKNNLEVISSLLELQSEGLDNEKAKIAVIEGQSRVQSIALIHHKLYRNDDISTVEFKSFVNDLYKQVSSVFKKPNTEIEFQIIASETQISIDTAVPIGLILNELLTNTFKYAVSKQKKNHIHIQLKATDKEGFNKIIYHDNGPGVPADFDIHKSTSLGMKVIHLLTKQLGGKLNFFNDNGSVFEIPFKMTS